MPYLNAGDTLGRWLVLEDAKTANDQIMCRCECGTEKRRYAHTIKSGDSRSCGCRRLEMQTSHGLSGHPLYGTWLNMVRRCTNPKDAGWHEYGGRGIRVCGSWLGDGGVANFIADMGPKPSPQHSL